MLRPARSPCTVPAVPRPRRGSAGASDAGSAQLHAVSGTQERRWGPGRRWRAVGKGASWPSPGHLGRGRVGQLALAPPREPSSDKQEQQSRPCVSRGGATATGRVGTARLAAGSRKPGCVGAEPGCFEEKETRPCCPTPAPLRGCHIHSRPSAPGQRVTLNPAFTVWSCRPQDLSRRKTKVCPRGPGRVRLRAQVEAQRWDGGSGTHCRLLLHMWLACPLGLFR